MSNPTTLSFNSQRIPGSVLVKDGEDKNFAAVICKCTHPSFEGKRTVIATGASMHRRSINLIRGITPGTYGEVKQRLIDAVAEFKQTTKTKVEK